MDRRIISAANRDFARRLGKLIDERGTTVKQLAKALHVTKNTVYYWLRGVYGPSLAALRVLKHVLKCTWGDLLGD